MALPRPTRIALVESLLVGAVCALGVAASAAGCGGADSADANSDGGDPIECTPIVRNGGGGVPRPPDGPSLCAEGPCNYQTQQGCAADRSCRPLYPAGATSVVPGCEAFGIGATGEACETSADCGRGLFCAAGACRKMCCGADWSACDAGESCIRQFLVEFGNRREHAVDLCFPVGTCDPFDVDACANESADGERECKIVDPKGSLACAPASSRGLGQSCSPPDVCAQGLSCVGGFCVQLCRTGAGECSEPSCPSPGHSCVHFDRDPPGIGECTIWEAP